MDINIKRVSKQLKSKKQWVCWKTAVRNGKETKLPVNPSTGRMAKSDDPSTWSSMMDAVSAYRNDDEMEGVGFMFSEDDPFVGIDLDDCRDAETGEWEDWALDILQDVEGFREISPSGTGGHIITIGEIPGNRNRKGSVEIYEELRYFTVTGDVISKDGEPVDTTPEIQESQHGLDAVYERFLADEDDGENGAKVDVDLSGLDHLNLENHGDGPATSYRNAADLDSLPENEQEIVKRAKGSKNGYKFTQLWRGDWESVYPSQSHSEGDMGFCDMLAFWCSGDPERMDRIFRASGLIRPKWDEKRYSDGSTYGERTIQRAIAKVSDYYDPDHYEQLLEEADGESESLDENGEGNENTGSGSTTSSSGQKKAVTTDDTDGSEAEADIDAEQSAEPEEESAASSTNKSESSSRRRRSRGDDRTGSFLLSPDDSKSEPTEDATSVDDTDQPEDDNSNTESDEDTGISDEEPADDTAEASGPSGSTADQNDSSRRRSRGGRNRISSTSEFSPVNAGDSNAEASRQSNGEDGEEEFYTEFNFDSDEQTSEEDSSDSDPGPVADSGSLFDREFDDDDFLDDIADEAEAESDGNDIGIDKDEAASIWDEDKDEEDPGSTTQAVGNEASPEGDESGISQERGSKGPVPGERLSANGRRKIPSARESTIEDLSIRLRRLESEFSALEEKHDNDIEHEEDKRRMLVKELEIYENVVDERDEEIVRLRKVLFLLCRYLDDPFFNAIEEALVEGEDIPVEEMLDHPALTEVREEAAADGGDELTTGGEWPERKQRSRQRSARTTSDLDDEDDDEEESNLKSRLSKYF